VTPWELDPGPEETSASAPSSPTSSNNNKFVSLFKSKHESKVSKRTSSSNHTFTPLPDIPMDLLDTYGIGGVPPVALQRSAVAKSKSVPAPKWPKPGGGRDRKGASWNAVSRRGRDSCL
jgi:hypothetical protein